MAAAHVRLFRSTFPRDVIWPPDHPSGGAHGGEQLSRNAWSSSLSDRVESGRCLSLRYTLGPRDVSAIADSKSARSSANRLPKPGVLS